MEITVKQRLAGAIVLIALGVIFIPMLLDGAGMKEKNSLELRMPPKPKYEFPHHVAPLPLPEPSQKPAMEKPAEQATKPAAKPKPEPKKAEAPKAEPIKVVPEKTEPPADRSPALVGYVVQVGSFGESKNALALRDKLRKAGYTAFVEGFKSQGKTMTRVKVGPVLKREEAEKLKQRLDKEMKLQGRIFKQ